MRDSINDNDYSSETLKFNVQRYRKEEDKQGKKKEEITFEPAWETTRRVRN